MSNVHEIIKVSLSEGSINVDINTKVNIALISHAIMLLGARHTQMLMGTQQEKPAVQVMPGNVLDRLKGNNGR